MYSAPVEDWEELDEVSLKDDGSVTKRPLSKGVVIMIPVEEEEVSFEEVYGSCKSEMREYLIAPADKTYRCLRYTSKNKYDLAFQLLLTHGYNL